MNTLKQLNRRFPWKQHSPRGKAQSLLGLVLCAVLIVVAGCDGGPNTLVSPETTTQSDLTATLNVCEVADFDDFEHGQAINSFMLDFGGLVGPVTFSVDTDGNKPGGGDNSEDQARAFNVDNEEDLQDPDLQDADGANGFCEDCNGQGIFLVISEENFDKFGDSDAGGDVTFARTDGEDFFIDSFLAADQEEDQSEGITLCEGDVDCESGSSDAVTDEANSFSGDGMTTTVDVSDPMLASAFTFDFDGSGAIDDVKICVEGEEEPGGGQGCTPGYWKQEHHFDSWVDFDQDDDFCTVFGCAGTTDLEKPEKGTLGDLTLLSALELRGGKLNALVRHAVAALLNASNDEVSYDLTESQVINAFNDALDDGGKKAIRDQKNEFEEFNEQGCPLN